jgi:3-phenylpropionate/cinnamic acid dioxygenase small subunit
MSDACSSYVEILNLVHRYPELIDAGDFDGVAELLRDAVVVFAGNEGAVLGEVSGIDAVKAMYRGVRIYPDGTPRTRHVISNEVVEVDEAEGTAVCRYYITVFQQTDDFPLQPVWANRYEDELRRVDGRWRIERRLGSGHMPGDTSRHLSRMPDL